MSISKTEREELKNAKDLLENPSIAAKISNEVGKPIDKIMEYLPEGWNTFIGKVVQKTLFKASEGAAFTLKNSTGRKPWNKLHKAGAALSGGIGGFIGFPALPFEIPISTALILRSIADIAQSTGERISSKETKIACLEVLALGGSSDSDDAAETGYYSIRAMLAKSVSDASKHLASKGISEDGAPVLVRLIAKIAEKFGVEVSQKVAAQAVPYIGAAAGATVNTIFMSHFQKMATGHFIIRKLERKYGKNEIERIYNQI